MSADFVDIPFYRNDGGGDQCMQVAMKSVIEYYSGEDYSLEDLDQMTGRGKDQWTWTPQLVNVLYDLGLEVEYYSTVDGQRLARDKSYFFEQYGEEAERLAEVVDLEIVINSIRKVMERGLFVKTKAEVQQVESAIDKGHVPLMLIDWNVLAGKEGEYQGHLVSVTGYDKDHFYYHEPGPKNPESDKKVDKDLFIEAWDQKETDHDLVIVRGRR
jgi:hypothetical protein